MPLPAATRSIFEYALARLRAEREKIEEKILTIERQLFPGDRATTASASIPATTSEAPVKKTRKKRKLSSAAKSKIAAAQKARWAAFHAAREAKPVKPVKKAAKKVAAYRRSSSE